MSEKCCICGHDKITVTMGASSREEQRYVCPDCGVYYATIFDAQRISGNENFHLHAPALAWERRMQKRDNYHLKCHTTTGKVYVGDILFTSDFPKTYPEKLDRALLNLANEANFSPREILYPHTELIGKKREELMDMCMSKGMNWNNLSIPKKRGYAVYRKLVVQMGNWTLSPKWSSSLTAKSLFSYQKTVLSLRKFSLEVRNGSCKIPANG